MAQQDFGAADQPHDLGIDRVTEQGHAREGKACTGALLTRDRVASARAAMVS
jgi:hypothetical protein